MCTQNSYIFKYIHNGDKVMWNIKKSELFASLLNILTLIALSWQWEIQNRINFFWYSTNFHKHFFRFHFMVLGIHVHQKNSVLRTTKQIQFHLLFIMHAAILLLLSLLMLSLYWILNVFFAAENGRIKYKNCLLLIAFCVNACSGMKSFIHFVRSF